MARMRKLTDQGRVSFVNGTYSQPHLQILSMESAIRQFEYGMQVDRGPDRLSGELLREPRSRACRRSSRRFCARWLSRPPPRPISRSGSECSSATSSIGTRYDFRGEDLVELARARRHQDPDLAQDHPATRTRACIADDMQHGLLNPTRLRVDMPDMIEVDEEWVGTIGPSSATW